MGRNYFESWLEGWPPGAQSAEQLRGIVSREHGIAETCDAIVQAL